MEKSPSLVYGARLELVYGLIAHRGFESLLLRQKQHPTNSGKYWVCGVFSFAAKMRSTRLSTSFSDKLYKAFFQSLGCLFTIALNIVPIDAEGIHVLGMPNQ